MNIFTGTQGVVVKLDDDSYHFREVMGENHLYLHFFLETHVEIPVGSFCLYNSETFTLNKEFSVIKNSSKKFEYKLVFKSESRKLNNLYMRDVVNGELGSLEFSLTAFPSEHLQMIVDNLNLREGAVNWSMSCISSDEIVKEYSSTTLLDALTGICDEIGAEWEIVGKVISIKNQVIHNSGDPLSLRYGSENGILPGLEKLNSSSDAIANKLFVVGGERNIDQAVYGSSKLLLPISQSYTYKDVVFESDEQGLSIKKSGDTGTTEAVLTESEIYPSRVGQVSEVIVVDENSNFYDITDNSIPDSLDYSECLMDGRSMSVVFQSGQLTGKEFDVAGVDDETRPLDTGTYKIMSDTRAKFQPKLLEARLFTEAYLNYFDGGNYDPYTDNNHLISVAKGLFTPLIATVRLYASDILKTGHEFDYYPSVIALIQVEYYYSNTTIFTEQDQIDKITSAHTVIVSLLEKLNSLSDVTPACEKFNSTLIQLNDAISGSPFSLEHIEKFIVYVEGGWQIIYYYWTHLEWVTEIRANADYVMYKLTNLKRCMETAMVEISSIDIEETLLMLTFLETIFSGYKTTLQGGGTLNQTDELFMSKALRKIYKDLISLINGYGFLSGSKRFQLVPKEYDEVVMPSASYAPIPGDKYAVFNINMPDAYVCDNATKTGASWDLFKAAAKHLYELQFQKDSFRIEIDQIWLKNHYAAVSPKLVCSGLVIFNDPQLQTETLSVRIKSIKTNINNPHSVTVELSDRVKKYNATINV